MRAVMASAVLFLVACSSTSPVRQVGPDEYVVAYRESGKLNSWNEIRGRSRDAAAQHCAQQGKQMQEIAVDTSGARGWSPQEAEIRFKCVAK